VLEPGQQVSVKILGIDEENERISLSIKATLPNEDVIESDEATTPLHLVYQYVYEQFLKCVQVLEHQEQFPQKHQS
jgi:predicted RNA-binding protein with RPS1 domain